MVATATFDSYNGIISALYQLHFETKEKNKARSQPINV
jgi:hypothetical protein